MVVFFSKRDILNKVSLLEKMVYQIKKSIELEKIKQNDHQNLINY